MVEGGRGTSVASFMSERRAVGSSGEMRGRERDRGGEEDASKWRSRVL